MQAKHLNSKLYTYTHTHTHTPVIVSWRLALQILVWALVLLFLCWEWKKSDKIILKKNTHTRYTWHFKCHTANANHVMISYYEIWSMLNAWCSCSCIVQFFFLNCSAFVCLRVFTTDTVTGWQLKDWNGFPFFILLCMMYEIYTYFG